MTHHTDWSLHEDGVELETLGACPVQSEGTVDGIHLYFRARNTGWTLELAHDPSRLAMGCFSGERDEWFFEGAYGTSYDAGWMCAAHSREIVLACIAAWRANGGARAPSAVLVVRDVPTGPDEVGPL